MAGQVGGFFGGLMAGQQFQTEQALASQQMQDNALIIKAKDLDIQKAQMDVESHRQMVNLAQQAFARQSAAAQAPSQDTPGMPAAPAAPIGSYDTLETYAKAAAAAGRPEQALDIMSKIGTLKKDDAEVAYKNSETRVKDLTLFANQMGAANIQTPQDWLSFWQARLGQGGINTADPVVRNLINAGMQPGADIPKLVAQVQDSTRSALDKAAAKKDDALARKADADAQLDSARAEADRARAGLDKERADVLRKTGGNVKEVKSLDVTKGTDEILYKYPSMDKGVAKKLGKDVAIIANKYMAGGMTEQESWDAAVKDLEKSGKLAGVGRPRREGPGSQNKPLDFDSNNPTTNKPFTKEEINQKWKAGQWGTIRGQLFFFDGDKYWTQEEYNQRSARYRGSDVDDPDTNTDGE